MSEEDTDTNHVLWILDIDQISSPHYFLLVASISNRYYGNGENKCTATDPFSGNSTNRSTAASAKRLKLNLSRHRMVAGQTNDLETSSRDYQPKVRGTFLHVSSISGHVAFSIIVSIIRCFQIRNLRGIHSPNINNGVLSQSPRVYRA